MNIHRFNSVGIDLGTTTSQVIFSLLEVVNTAGPTSVPHYEFTKREIRHVSQVLFTPFDLNGSIDVAAIECFIQDEYQRAGLAVGDVSSGAVIITGETSKAKNARHAVMAVADKLGDFVVATAGPHLESVIAGRGSGAGEYSRENAARVLNIDIGGGTSNYVVFEGGRVVDSACLNIGGHLIELDSAGGVTRIHQPARHLLETLGMAVIRDYAQLREIARLMARWIVDAGLGADVGLASALMMTNPLQQSYRYDAVFISGGVGACLIDDKNSDDIYRYNDIGPLLAEELRAVLAATGWKVRQPTQTLRATVIGAGAHSLILSGSTVWNRYRGNPLRNVPVVKSRINWRDYRPSNLVAGWTEALRRMDLDPVNDLYALAIPDAIPLTCQSVWQIALDIQAFDRSVRSSSLHPIVVVTGQDVGKSIGLELFRLMPARVLLVIDEVDTQEGDYLDIGNSYYEGGTLPITVKSLAFPN